MAADIQYKGWNITPQSRRDRFSGRWHPSARVRQPQRPFLNPPVDAPLVVTTDTSDEANAYAITLAKQWIDRQAPVLMDETR
jgi:hypothetical protein